MLSRFSCVRLFATLWTAARQAPLSMGTLQARLLEWVVMPSSRGSSGLGLNLHLLCLLHRRPILYCGAPGEDLPLPQPFQKHFAKGLRVIGRKATEKRKSGREHSVLAAISHVKGAGLHPFNRHYLYPLITACAP